MGETSQLVPEWKARADEIWALLRETDQIIKESSKESAQRQKEIDRRFQESAERLKEIDRILKENAQRQQETDRCFQETAEQQKKTNG
jgi:hypothetical protein